MWVQLPKGAPRHPCAGLQAEFHLAFRAVSELFASRAKSMREAALKAITLRKTAVLRLSQAPGQPAHYTFISQLQAVALDMTGQQAWAAQLIRQIASDGSI